MGEELALERIFDKPFHQLAMYVDHPEQAVQSLSAMGYTEWIYDEADLVGDVMGEEIKTHGRMWFNYEFAGGELEFLHYEGPSWHSMLGIARTTKYGDVINGPFVSHKSVYVENLGEAGRKLEMLGFVAVQRFETQNHINKHLLDKKERFREAVYGARHLFGFDLKLIQRIYDR